MAPAESSRCSFPIFITAIDRPGVLAASYTAPVSIRAARSKQANYPSHAPPLFFIFSARVHPCYRPPFPTCDRAPAWRRGVPDVRSLPLSGSLSKKRPVRPMLWSSVRSPSELVVSPIPILSPSRVGAFGPASRHVDFCDPDARLLLGFHPFLW